MVQSFDEVYEETINNHLPHLIDDLKDIQAGTCKCFGASWWMTIIEEAFIHIFGRLERQRYHPFEKTKTYFLHMRECICEISNDIESFVRLGFRQFRFNNSVSVLEKHHRLWNNMNPAKSTEVFKIDGGDDGVVWTINVFRMTK